MNKHSMPSTAAISSSTAAAGLTFALTLAAGPPCAHRREPSGRMRRSRPIVWLTIGADGTITIVSPAAEMGQGSFTTLPRDPRRRARRRLGQGEAGAAAGLGRQEIRQSRIRLADSRPRRALRCAAISSRCASPAPRRAACCSMPSAAKWGVPVGELSTEPSVVVHKASGRRIRYGEIAAFAKSPAELPKIDDKRPQAGRKLPAHRQGHSRGSSAAQGHGRRQIRDGCAGAGHGLRRGAAIALSRAARRRTVDDTQARASARRHRRGEAAGRRRRHRHHGRGDAGGEEPAPEGHLERCAGRAATTARSALDEFAAIGPRQEPRGRAVREDRRRQGRDGRAPPR